MADIIRNEVIDAVLTRQTIREYKPIMLTDAQLDTLTAAAMMAPSGRNCQPCHVRFICNDAMLLKIQSYEQVFKLFFKFILAKVLVQNARGLMGIIYNGFNQIAVRLGETNYGFLDSFTPEALVTKPDSAGFLNLNYLVKYLEAMPTYLILMGACWIINLILIGRLFEIVVYTVVSPIPLSTFAGEGWHDIAKAFIKSYAAVCLQGVVVIVMFYAFAQIVELLGGTSTVGITITTLSLALGVAKSGQWARQALGA